MKTYSLSRLLQLCSANLPLGSYSYSQGMEWAVQQGWISNAEQTREWLSDLIKGSLSQQELPLLAQMYDAWGHVDGVECELETLKRLTQLSVASRETRELREEEFNRAHAMHRLLVNLTIDVPEDAEQLLATSPLAGFSLAGLAWEIPREELLQGYAFSWVESLVYAAVKLVPLGQSDAQNILLSLHDDISDAVELAHVTDLPFPVFSNPAVAFASSAHETQYSRLFRS